MGAYEYGFKVHFSDYLIADVLNAWFNIAFVDGVQDDLIGPGDYPDTEAALVDVLNNPGYKTLDGIAIPEGVKLTIWNEQNYQGDILLEKEGPAIIFNRHYYGVNPPTEKKNSDWSYFLQLEFPQSLRFWSDDEMTNGYLNYWTDGSFKIERLK